MNRTKCVLFAGLFFILTAGAIFPCFADTETINQQIARVEANLLPAVIIAGEPAFRLQERMAHYKVPGLSIAVFKDFEVLWSKQYGLADAGSGAPVTASTRFNVGSLSKGVASLVVLSLVNEGLVELDGQVNLQLRSWQIPENRFTSEAPVTPRLLMNHSGGANFSPAVSYPPERFPTLLQVLKGEPPSNTKPVVIDLVPATQFQYSNAGYAILQLLAMDTSGESFETLAQERIFRPLAMPDSSFRQTYPSEELSGLSAGHQADGKPGEIKRYVYPIQAAGGLWSTTDDYARFLVEIQKSYQGVSNKIISRKLAREMLSPQAARQYGLGVFMREKDGEIHYFGHMGDNRGFFAGYAAHRTDGYGAVVFTNSQSGVQLIREIIQSVAWVYGWDNYLPEILDVVPLEDKALEAFAGRYQLGTDASFTVKADNGQLLLDQFGGVRLFHVGEGRFVSKYRKGSLQFETTASGPAASAVFHFSDTLGRFLEKPTICNRIDPQVKLPYQLLEDGRFEEALAAYQRLKATDPADKSVSENRLNQMGYSYLGQEKLDHAIAAFKVNVELHPQSWNCFDSLAEAYMLNGDRELAIQNFKRSVELNQNNQHGISLLKKLKDSQ